MPDSPLTDPLALCPTDYFSSGDRRAIGNPQLQRVPPATPLGLVGEFTPELEDDEVEILCIGLRSVMGDAISARARPEGDKIAHQVPDESVAASRGSCRDAGSGGK